jgi:hypothetical protein
MVTGQLQLVGFLIGSATTNDWFSDNKMIGSRDPHNSDKSRESVG